MINIQADDWDRDWARKINSASPDERAARGREHAARVADDDLLDVYDMTVTTTASMEQIALQAYAGNHPDFGVAQARFLDAKASRDAIRARIAAKIKEAK